MKLSNPKASAMTDKNRDIAYKSVKQVLDGHDLEAWSCLIENSDRIFPFVKENIAKNFSNIVNINNYSNLLSLFKIYSFDFDDCFAEILAALSSQNSDITDKMLELLRCGCDDEKSYAAKYFCYINDNRAVQYLFDAYSTNNEALKYNSARALGDMKDEDSYNYFVNKLNSEDDWEKADAVQFLQAYGDKKAFSLMLEAMKTSSMPENIAGHIAMLENLSDFLGVEDKNIEEMTLECLQNIILSEAEIWPLSTIIDFKIYESLEKLIELFRNSDDNSIKGRYAAILLFAKKQFSMFLENNEYKFNEDKDTLAELDEIVALLHGQSDDFWQNCKSFLADELKSDNLKRVCFAIDVINELDLNEFSSNLNELIESRTDETVIYKAVMALCSFNQKENINPNILFEKIQDENLKAHITALLK